MSQTQKAAAPAFGGWHKVADYDTFIKWAYKRSPYRVIADLEESRGMWRVVFTSVYGGESYLIRGNLGKNGRMKAILIAQKFFSDNPWGCSPPSEYTD